MGTAPGEEQRRVWTVSELAGTCRDLLEEAFLFVWVRGEISRLVRHSSGHWYFNLKDGGASVSVAMFSRANKQVPFDVEEGMEIILGGQATIYPPRGQFQIVAEILEPVGWGALQLAYEQLKTRLAEEGLFDADRKRPLPVLPRCVGIVTSPTGAAWRDMCRVWKKNAVPIRALLSPARVQGTGAADDIIAALERLNRHAEADVIIVGRGGGSREDLWAFNEEALARAIAASAIPVVSAVGHEIDQTIADLVADQRAATPTAAAELVAASRQLLLDRIDGAGRRARSAVGRRLLVTRARLREPALQRSLGHPARLLSVYRQRLDEAFGAVKTPADRSFVGTRQALESVGRRLTSKNLPAMALKTRVRVDGSARRLATSLQRLVEHRRSRLTTAIGRIDALSPLAVLGRGYAICERRLDGAIVRSADDVAAGDQVRVRLRKDALDCTVVSTEKGTIPQPL